MSQEFGFSPGKLEVPILENWKLQFWKTEVLFWFVLSTGGKTEVPISMGTYERKNGNLI
jgi:hypothetical protein